MKYIILTISILLGSTAFSNPRKEVSFSKLVTEELDYTLTCDLRYRATEVRGSAGAKLRKRMGIKKPDIYSCSLPKVRDYVASHSSNNGGEYIAYEIIDAPKGFLDGYFTRKENKLKILVKYVK